MISSLLLFQPLNRHRLGLLLGSSLFVSSAALGQTFSPLVSYSATSGGSPQAVTTADFNKDGRLDVAIANYAGHSVAVLLGQANGTLGTAATYGSGASGYPQGIATGDFNGDGRPDLVVANSNSNTLGVLLAQANGTFGAVTTYAAGTYTSQVAVGDINKDGKLDLVATGTNSGNILVLLGQGNGLFNAALSYSTGGNSRPAAVALADLNGDGRLDAVVANSDANTVGVLLGQANGTLGSMTSYSAGYTPYRVALADINGDGRLDLLTLILNGDGRGIQVRRGQAGGTFSEPTSTPVSFDGMPSDLAVGDVNLDGRPDAIVPQGFGNQVEIYLGQPDGRLGTYTSIGTGDGTSPNGVAVADLNSDGRPDIVLANGDSNAAGVLLNQTSLVASPIAAAVSSCGGQPVTLTASGAPAGGSYRWYTQATGGTAISGATGSSYTTPTLYTSAAYYVSAIAANGSESSRTAVAVTINYALPPTIVAGGPTTFDGGGSVTLTAKPNLALKLDGSSQYVTTTLDAQPSALPTTTWEAWVYPTRTNYGTRQTIFSIDDGAYDRGVDIEANTSNFAIFTGQGVWQPTTADLNTWQHIAVVYTPTGISFYKNGVEYLYNTSQGFSLNPTVNKFQIGRNPGFNEPFAGQLDEVRVWNYQRTQTQIQAAMFAVPAGTTAGLVGSWSLNEGSGKTATDATGNYPGTLISTPAYVTPGQSSITSTYAWTPSAGLSSSTAQTVTAAPSATTTYTVAVNDNASCSQTASQTVTVYADLVVSTAGQTVAAGTYNSITVRKGGVATLGGNVVVNRTVTVQDGGTLNTSCQALTGAGSFTLAAGGTLGICDPAGIEASGNSGAVQLTGTRSFSADASYVYNGGNAQVTGAGLPSQVRNFTTSNANAVRLSNPLSISQVLTVAGSGNFDLNGQALTLLSNSTGSALVVNSGTGIVSGGTATVQRYLDPAFNTGMGYRHYSAPVSGSTVADLATTTGFAPVVNDAYNTSATPGTVTPFPTVFGYDQSRLASTTSNYPAFDKGFFSPSDLTDKLAMGQGYAVQIGADQLVDFTGQLNTGATTLTLGRNDDATAADAGWALVGNPYPAPLDWSQVAAADRTNLDGSIYVVQSTGPYTGSYRAYVNNVSTSGTNSPLIGTGQGFFVRVSSGQTSGTLTFRNSQRVTDYASQAPVYRTTADQRPLVQLELRTSTGQADGLAVYAEAGATPGFDAQYDAGKLVNSTGLNLASVSSANESLAIDGRPAFTAATVVPLTVGVPAAGTYSLAAAALNNLPAGLDAYLTDAQTGQTVRLGQQNSYSFSVTAAEATALLTGRFTLTFKGAAPLASTPAVPTVTEVALYPNPASERFKVSMPAVAGASQVQATLLNTLGQVVRRQAAALPATGATLTVEAAGLPAGVYTLRLQAGATTIAKRVIIK